MIPACPTPTARDLGGAIRRPLAAALLAATLLTALAPAQANSSLVFRSQTQLLSQYHTEGFIRHDAPVFGQFLSYDSPDFPLYGHIATVRDFDRYSEDELALGYSYHFLDSRFKLGLLYSQEVRARDILDTAFDSAGVATGVIESSYQFSERNSEFFMSLETEELYNTRFDFHYRYDLESQGSLINLGLEFDYPLGRSSFLVLEALLGFEGGYASREGLKGFYHINYGAGVDYDFFPGSGLRIMLVYIAPYRNAAQHGVEEGIVYQAGLYFAFR